ncbi:MAG: hypothetical protein GKR87_04910 [Kiritimatiellae bacterium]|nr:hypothetical protein [Kiritimatiellia bacterium]
MLLISLFMLEGGLRGYFYLRNTFTDQKKELSTWFGWKTNPSISYQARIRGYGLITYSTTHHGFRVWGDENSARKKFLVLGDSSTEAAQVSDGKTYYDMIKKHHDEVEIFAYGAGGYSSLQEYMILDTYFDTIKPDLVIWQFDGNDLINNNLNWESISKGNNNHMTRPYLINGEIEHHYPYQSKGFFSRFLESSYILRLLNVHIALFSKTKRERGEDSQALTMANPLFAKSTQITRQILQKVKHRIGDTPLLAFSIYGGGIESLYKQICQDLSFHFVSGVTDAVIAQKNQGLIVTGMEAGQEIDSHFNDAGHAIVGGMLLEYMMRAGLLESHKQERSFDLNRPVLNRPVKRNMKNDLFDN